MTFAGFYHKKETFKRKEGKNSLECQKDFIEENLNHGLYSEYNKEILSASGGGANLREIHPTTNALPLTPCSL